ncbi:MAG: type II secretion system protein [Armatimonadota bacterium]
MSKPTMRFGFTLVEMLVVIAMIAVLMGILFPVFNRVRETARQTKCQGNLAQLAIAMKKYRADVGLYPPAPRYNEDAQVYTGGFSALFPDYIDDTGLFICPDDRTIDGVEEAARQRLYCSYNGKVSGADPETEASWHFDTGTFTHIETDASMSDRPTRWYNYYGYTNSGVDPYNAIEGDTAQYPYATSVPAWLTDRGFKYRQYPRLMNRHAPDFTIITHCTHHRAFTGEDTEQIDINLYINGKTERVNRMTWQAHQDGGVSKFVKQYQ